MKVMRYAVCAIVERDGELLIISRGDDLSNWNLPGGKVEPGEPFIEAVRRELYEETGLLAGRVSYVYQAVCPGDVAYLTLCYVVDAYSGTAASSGEGLVRWGSWDEILTPTCSFNEFNRNLRDAYTTWKENQTDRELR